MNAYDEGAWKRDLLPLLPKRLRGALLALGSAQTQTLEEIRLRAGRPVQLLFGTDEQFLLDDTGDTITVQKEECAQFLNSIAFHSIYALEEELRSGYITLPGGYRVGLAGRAVLSGRALKLISNPSSFNVRIARQKLGAASKLLEHVLFEGRPVSTLIVSPPGCGKTTILRDLARQLSDGAAGHLKVCIADERSELAGCYMGVPQNDVGKRTDVLDGCPKAEAIALLLRAMSPDVIVTDEIGREEDMPPLLDAANAGVAIIATAHGRDVADIMNRPLLRRAVESRIFKRYAVLGRSLGVGTLEAVMDGELKPILSEPVR